MNKEDMLKIFKDEKVLLSGHFLLSSGLHSPNYMQCALLFQKPWIAQKICTELAKKVRSKKIEVVIGPALGGMIVAYEMARALKVRALFAERINGNFTLRRGFSLKKNEKVLVMEDVVTTGKSTYETISLVEQTGAKVEAVGAIVDRSGGAAVFAQDFYPLLSMEIKAYKPAHCRLCEQKKIPLTKPGSRELIWIAGGGSWMVEREK